MAYFQKAISFFSPKRLKSDFASFNRVLGCGITPYSARVVNEENASPHAWPWQISLRVNGRHICGRSLFKNDWVVTGAHCVDRNPRPSAYTVVVGKYFCFCFCFSSFFLSFFFLLFKMSDADTFFNRVIGITHLAFISQTCKKIYFLHSRSSSLHVLLLLFLLLYFFFFSFLTMRTPSFFFFFCYFCV